MDGAEHVQDALIVASLLQLKCGAGAPSKKAKRSRVSKKQKVKCNPPPVSPRTMIAAGDAGAAAGAAGAAASVQGETGALHVHAHEMDAVVKELQKAEAAGEINPNCFKRLKVLLHLLHTCYEEGLLTYETPARDPSSASPSPQACILGWSKLLVNKPLKLNLRIRQMIEEDEYGIWRKANGKHNQKLKNPTWSVYELFRKIGVKPHFRGPAEGDPGKPDMFYYREWEFKNDESFRNARARLAKGFCYCPEKGNRKRKIAPKQ